MVEIMWATHIVEVMWTTLMVEIIWTTQIYVYHCGQRANRSTLTNGGQRGPN